MPRKRQEGIHVTVVDFGREHLVLRWRDPITRKVKHETSGTNNRAEANKRAAKKETQLELQIGSVANLGWEKFVDRYSTEYLSTLAEATKKKATTSLRYVTKVLKPDYLSDVTTSRLSAMFDQIRRVHTKTGRVRSESTYAGYARQIKAALGWAVELELLAKVPKMPRMKRFRDESAKSRAITEEELLAILDAVPKVKHIGSKRSASWCYLLMGLWWSGLRLEEALHLHWTDPQFMRVDVSGRRPLLLIRSEGEKGFKDRQYPVAPEFAVFLLRTPPEQRKGFVFNPTPYSARGERISLVTLGRTIVAIGETAGVKSRDEDTVTKYASAHDYRRAFGFRWSSRVMPAVLKELMRHKNIDTTMKYYVTVNAQATAEVLWSVVPHPLIDLSNISDNSENSPDYYPIGTCSD